MRLPDNVGRETRIGVRKPQRIELADDGDRRAVFSSGVWRTTLLSKLRLGTQLRGKFCFAEAGRCADSGGAIELGGEVRSQMEFGNEGAKSEGLKRQTRFAAKRRWEAVWGTIQARWQNVIPAAGRAFAAFAFASLSFSSADAAGNGEEDYLRFAKQRIQLREEAKDVAQKRESPDDGDARIRRPSAPPKEIAVSFRAMGAPNLPVQGGFAAAAGAMQDVDTLADSPSAEAVGVEGTLLRGKANQMSALRNGATREDDSLSLNFGETGSGQFSSLTLSDRPEMRANLSRADDSPFVFARGEDRIRTEVDAIELEDAVAGAEQEESRLTFSGSAQLERQFARSGVRYGGRLGPSSAATLNSGDALSTSFGGGEALLAGLAVLVLMVVMSNSGGHARKRKALEEEVKDQLPESSEESAAQASDHSPRPARSFAVR